ncbi:hypothetical protein SAY86_022645 [Trapa natans]|uniref:Xyloglucan endotransglucosylase/hydrolase n=1 Tax=Trapa natans TaxID=22666 RepID=A0AAN7LTV3_TRANT|nr:hypothetical protein SAY86_022645 [Trapa natans]
MVVPVMVVAVLVTSMVLVEAGNFTKEVDITWGDGRAKILNGGHLLTLTLDQASGSGFQSKSEYMYGKFDMQIKLVPGNSAGTVVAYYLRSQGSAWDEIDLEFLGNLSSDPYVLHTNVFTEGQGNREQQFYLWFDPTANFHTYSVLWNPSHLVLYVDGVPIREFKNLEGAGVPYPKSQPMRVYASIWNADNWATRGGLVKTDWSLAPFTASFSGFNANKACIWMDGASSCGGSVGTTVAASSLWPWMAQKGLDGEAQTRMEAVQRKYMIYSYCQDSKRFPQGLPRECSLTSKTRP